MQIFVPAKSNLNAIQLTAETTKSPLFCVGRPKKKENKKKYGVGLLRGSAGGNRKAFALFKLYYT